MENDKISMVNMRENPPTGVIKFASKDDPSVCGTLVGDFELNINTTYGGEKLTLTVSSKEMPPDGPFEPKLTNIQFGALWLITEGSVFSNVNGMPGWKLAEIQKIRTSNLTRDVIKPFEKWGLICYVPRKSTRKGTANPNQPEKAYYIKRIGLRKTFNILLTCFNKRYFNNMTWKECKPEELTYENYIANKRFITLALLQKKLREYENSCQYHDDLIGKFSDRCEVRPQLAIVSKK